MDPGLPFADLLAYNANETDHWKRWFGENAAALDLTCDVAGAGSVRNLLLHIFATELFFAKATPEEWSTPVSLGFRDFKASKRKMLAQAIWHSINHRGQLATFLRQQGFKQDWIHDILASKVMD